MCFVSVSVFRPSVSSLALVFLVAQLFVIVRLLRHGQLSVCVCVCVCVLQHPPGGVVCIFVCVVGAYLSLWDCVNLSLCNVSVCVLCMDLCVCVFSLMGSCAVSAAVSPQL